MFHNPRQASGKAWPQKLAGALLIGGMTLGVTAHAQTTNPAPRFSAEVRAVLDDGTIALSLGSVLTPVRLAGITLFPGAIPAIQKALPVGAQVYVQIVKKGQPAMANVWVRGKPLQDALLAQKLAMKVP